MAGMGRDLRHTLGSSASQVRDPQWALSLLNGHDQVL